MWERSSLGVSYSHILCLAVGAWLSKMFMVVYYKYTMFLELNLRVLFGSLAALPFTFCLLFCLKQVKQFYFIHLGVSAATVKSGRHHSHHLTKFYAESYKNCLIFRNWLGSSLTCYIVITKSEHPSQFVGINFRS